MHSCLKIVRYTYVWFMIVLRGVGFDCWGDRFDWCLGLVVIYLFWFGCSMICCGGFAAFRAFKV